MTPALVLLTFLATPLAHAAKAPKAATAAPAASAKTAARAKTAKTAPLKAAQAAPAELTNDQRGKLAVAAVRHDLKAWVTKGTNVTVRPALVPFNGDAKNPITGQGPVSVYVTQQPPAKRGLINRIRAALNPFHKQIYMVHVDDNGQTAIMDRQSLAPQRRFARFVLNKLALGAMVKDFMSSGKVTETAVTAIGATGAAVVSPLLSGALFMRAAQVLTGAIKTQSTARKTAMNETVSWAQALGKKGSWPTLMDSYRAYQSNVAAQDKGVTALSLSDFATQLSIHQL